MFLIIAHTRLGEARARAFNRLKYAPVLFFFNYYLRVRRDSVVRAILRFTARSGTAIETIAINNLWYELRENTERAKHRKKSVIVTFHFIQISLLIILVVFQRETIIGFAKLLKALNRMRCCHYLPYYTFIFS